MQEHPISSRQREYLSIARQEPDSGFRLLYSLVREGEDLAPDWLDLWDEIRRVGQASVPPTILRQVEEAVSQLKPIDDEIFTIRLTAKDNVTLLLGAGASAPSNIPTVASLLPELLRRAKKMGRDDIDGLATWCESQGISNIEDLLTAAYVANFAAKNPQITGLLDYFLFRSTRSQEETQAARRLRSSRPTSAVDVASIALVQDTLQVLFGLLAGIMIPAAPNDAHAALVRFTQRHGRTSIVTTNYDGCIDEALTRASVPVATGIDEDGSPSASSADLNLIKMHGSINWTYCDSCQEVKQFDLLEMKKNYEKDLSTYAVIGICKACGGQRRPLLVPPMAFKFIMFPNLIGIWNVARERIEQSDYIVVVGHSFSEADAYISKIISRSFSLNKKQKMIVVDPNPRLVPTLRERFAAYIDGFDPKRILQAAGSCDEVLPRILESLTGVASELENAAGQRTQQAGASRRRTRSK